MAIVVALYQSVQFSRGADAVPGLIGFEDVAHDAVCSLRVGSRRVIKIARLRGVRCMRLREGVFPSKKALPLMRGVYSATKDREGGDGEWKQSARALRCC